MRSEVTSRSNWANDSNTFRVSRPIEVVVLNCWVTETKDTPWRSTKSNSLAKSPSERVRRSTFVDHDDVHLAGPDVSEQPLQRRPFGRASGIAPVIVTGPDQGPAGMGLAADI